MKVNIEELNVKMELQRRGISIRIRDNDDVFIGDMILNSSGMKWCAGRTTPANGKKKSWQEIIDFINT
ncbi:MAG TPA: hypothetical protein DG942_01875 [Ruminococcaceae bacterium]|nr:hypothetical protein [Oscillospiraceae bacterium]